MGIFSKIFGSKKSAQQPSWRVGGTEDFMMLIKVYYQATIAAQFGLRDLRALPDLRIFKQTLHIPTVNNRIGTGEKKKCKALMGELYGMSDGFFTEIDASIKRRCRNVQDVQNYLYQFQGFSQELMMLVGNLMKWKFRVPSFMKSALRSMTAKTINDIMTKDNWKEAEVRKSVVNVRSYQHNLGYSPEWMAEYVYNFVILAKREPKADATADEK